MPCLAATDTVSGSDFSPRAAHPNASWCCPVVTCLIPNIPNDILILRDFARVVVHVALVTAVIVVRAYPNGLMKVLGSASTHSSMYCRTSRSNLQ
jgi:hypothetical protein